MNSTVGIKIIENNVTFNGIMIIREYYNNEKSISEIKELIYSNNYIAICDYIDKSGIEKILKLYSKLNNEGIKCELYEHEAKTTTEFLNNLLESYNQTEIEVEEDIERGVQTEILENVLSDFIKYSDVDEKTIRQYENQLPQEIINLWKNYGYGTLYNGYLKVINPNEYKELVEKSYFQGNVSIPIFATAFGDIITWEKNQFLGIIKYRYGENDVISDGFDFFFEDLQAGEFDKDHFTISKYNEAIDKYGKLEYDECFGYTPILAMGGNESVENLKKVKIKEYIAIISNFIGEI